MKYRMMLFLLLLSLSLLLIGCNNDETDQLKTIRMASWSQPITEQINLLSEEIDYFSQNGIDVDFIPGAGGGDAIKNIASGKADIAFTDPGSFFNALDQGEDLLAVYNIYPQNVFNVVSLKDSDITTPEDLKGKKVGVYSLSSGTRQNLLVLLRQAGLSEDDVEIIETGVLNFAPLMQGQVDATAATDTGLATGLAKGLGEVNVMEVKDYFNYSSDLFVITKETYDEKREVIDLFLTSYIDSVEWMMENPEVAATHAVHNAIDGKDEAHNLSIIELRNDASIPLSGDLADLGEFDFNNFQEAADLYYELGLINRPLYLDDVIVNGMEEE